MKRTTRSLAVILSACGLAACSGTDTGNPFEQGGSAGNIDDGGEGTAGGACDEVVSDIELGAGSTLGFSANQVLEFAGGTHTVPLAWLDSDIEYGPESGRSAITIEVEPLGARFVDRSPASSSGAGPTIDIGTPLDGCRDSLRIDVRLHVSSAGGALAETVESTLEAYEADFASGGFGLDLEAIAGTFQAEIEPPRNSEVTSAGLAIRMGFSEHGVVGELEIGYEFRSLDGGAAGVGVGLPIAQFPADDYCGQTNTFSVAADQEVRGVSMAAALDALNGAGPIAVRYQTGASSTIEVVYASDAARTCVSLGRDTLYNGTTDTALLFPGTVTLESLDGRLDGEFPVTISASSRETGFMFYAGANESTQDVTQAASFARERGVQDDVDVTGYDGVSISFQGFVAQTTAGGSLVVNGLTVPECLTNAPVIEPGATSYPGCSGIVQDPLWSAAWGDPTDQ